VRGEFEMPVTLRSVVRVAAARPGAPLVLALHGMGMTARAFERWLQPALERGALSWWLPQGVFPREESRRIGYAWYVFDGDQGRLRESMDEARAHLLAVAGVARRALRPSRLALLGFSQGAYLASYVALSRPDLFRDLVCCCGRPKAEFASDLAAARSLRVMVMRGAGDDAVPADVVAKGVAPLREAGLEVEEHLFDAGHRLTPEMAVAAAEFLTRP
jgi:predicted esterase